MSQTNLTTTHVRSVSFFNVRGKPMEPPTLICGSCALTPGKSTRAEDRDVLSSRKQYGEEGMKAFDSDRFQRLDPKSNFGEKVSKEFCSVAEQVKGTLFELHN